MSFREIAYTLIDEDIAYLSPSAIYRILKRHNLITPWKHPVWESTRPEHAKSPDEKWQTDIMYVKIRGRFFYLIIFIDEYSRYIVHHNLLATMDADSVSWILSMLGISRSWYYSQISFSPILDGRFNPLAVRDNDE